MKNYAKLAEVNSLVEKEQLEQALATIEEVENDRGEICMEEYLQIGLQKGRIHYRKGSYDASLEISSLIHEQGREHELPSVQVDAAIGMINSLWYLSRLDSALDLALETEKLMVKHKEIDLHTEEKLLSLIALLYSKLAEYDNSIEYMQRCIKLAEELDDPIAISYNLNLIGINYKNKGNTDLALDYSKKALAISEEVNDYKGIYEVQNSMGILYQIRGEFDKGIEAIKQAIIAIKKIPTAPRIALAGLYKNIGSIHQQKGEYAFALTYLQQSLEINEEFNYDYGIGLVSNIVGLLHIKLGELDKAQSSLEKSLTYMKNLGIDERVAHTQINLGILSLIKGDLDQSEIYFNDCMVILKKIGNETFIAGAQEHLGTIARLRGDTQTALSHFNKALEIRRGRPNKMSLGNSLFYLLLMYENTGDLNHTRDIAHEILDLGLDRESNSGKLLHQISEAIYLKSNKKYEDARNLLSEIIDQETIDISITILAMYNLSEIYLIQYKDQNDHKLIAKTRDIIQKIRKIAIEQHLLPDQVNVRIFEAKIHIIEFDTDQARETLLHGKDLAEDIGLGLLSEQCTRELHHLDGLLLKWQNLAEKSVSVEERLLATEIMQFVRERGTDRGLQPQFQ